MYRSSISKRSRIEGGLVGLLVGDALGVPYEFHRAEEIPEAHLIEMSPPSGFVRAHQGIPEGTWSDDGAQALCLLASLLQRDRLDIWDVSDRFLRWQRHGYMAVDDHMFDIGNQTTHALMRLRAGVSPEESGPCGERDNGNGSLMRVLPLALWHEGDDAELVADAHAQSATTHGHARTLVCCAWYCLVARRMLAGDTDPWEEAADALSGLYRDRPALQRELQQIVRVGVVPTGSGYVLDTLHSTRWALKHPGYEEAVRAAIMLGQDTDTTACVVGGLAGIRGGISDIPSRWRQTLRGEALLAPLRDALIARTCG